jgi:hypothetical protein
VNESEPSPAPEIPEVEYDEDYVIYDSPGSFDASEFPGSAEDPADASGSDGDFEGILPESFGEPPNWEDFYTYEDAPEYDSYPEEIFPEDENFVFDVGEDLASGDLSLTHTASPWSENRKGHFRHYDITLRVTRASGAPEGGLMLVTETLSPEFEPLDLRDGSYRKISSENYEFYELGSSSSADLTASFDEGAGVWKIVWTVMYEFDSTNEATFAVRVKDEPLWPEGVEETPVGSASLTYYPLSPDNGFSLEFEEAKAPVSRLIEASIDADTLAFAESILSDNAISYISPSVHTDEEGAKVYAALAGDTVYLSGEIKWGNGEYKAQWSRLPLEGEEIFSEEDFYEENFSEEDWPDFDEFSSTEAEFTLSPEEEAALLASEESFRQEFPEEIFNNGLGLIEEGDEDFGAFFEDGVELATSDGIWEEAEKTERLSFELPEQPGYYNFTFRVQDLAAIEAGYRTMQIISAQAEMAIEALQPELSVKIAGEGYVETRISSGNEYWYIAGAGEFAFSEGIKRGTYTAASYSPYSFAGSQSYWEKMITLYWDDRINDWTGYRQEMDLTGARLSTLPELGFFYASAWPDAEASASEIPIEQAVLGFDSIKEEEEDAYQ